jgi:hypothetical protein
MHKTYNHQTYFVEPPFARTYNPLPVNARHRWHGSGYRDNHEHVSPTQWTLELGHDFGRLNDPNDAGVDVAQVL